MKNVFQRKRSRKAKQGLLSQKGQSLVEFALLLLVITSISFGFIRLANSNLGRLWTAYVRLIVDDPAQNGTLTIAN